jgi:hypothetical protein
MAGGEGFFCCFFRRSQHRHVKATRAPENTFEQSISFSYICLRFSRNTAVIWLLSSWDWAGLLCCAHSTIALALLSLVAP